MNGNNSASFLIEGGTIPAYFEASARIENGFLDAFWTYRLAIESGGIFHRVELDHGPPEITLRIQRERSTADRTDLASVPLLELTSSAPITITLRAELTATRIKAAATVNGITKEIAVDTMQRPDLALPATYRHGLAFYRDAFADPTVTSSYTQYYSITRPKP